MTRFYYLLMCLVLILINSCREDEKQLALCLDNNFTYQLNFHANGAADQDNDYWIYFTDQEGAIAQVERIEEWHQAVNLITDHACAERNTVTIVRSYQNPSGERSIGFKSFAEVPSDAKIQRLVGDMFSRSGRSEAYTIEVSGVPPVDTVICAEYSNTPFLSYEYLEDQSLLRISLAEHFVDNQKLWFQIKPVGESQYYCREFMSAFEDHSSPHPFSSFLAVATEQEIQLSPELTFIGSPSYRLYGMQTEGTIHRALLAKGAINGSTIKPLIAAGSYNYYMLEVFGNTAQKAIRYKEIYTDNLSTFININPKSTAVTAQFTYPEFTITATGADLIKLYLQKDVVENGKEINMTWSYYLPASVAHSGRFPSIPSEIIDHEPTLSNLSDAQTVRAEAFDYHFYEGYEQVLPFLHDEPFGRLWNFDARSLHIWNF